MFHAAMPGSSEADTKRRALSSTPAALLISAKGDRPRVARSALINAATPQSPHEDRPDVGAGIVVVVVGTGDFGALFFSL